ncbi:PREDICTED: keratin-associated protein 10-4-like [Cariama cristata]|uniref:keratin-associated protein 10-4-like n=1 Tax=Cariama cristata TaxID=54380 RepID=UPI000520DE8E|nr:PREDICTED: keratin-associated protein 10-4-like [Cariama cristata]
MCEAGYPAEHVLTPPSPPGQRQPEAQPVFQQTPAVTQLLSDRHTSSEGGKQPESCVSPLQCEESCVSPPCCEESCVSPLCCEESCVSPPCCEESCVSPLQCEESCVSPPYCEESCMSSLRYEESCVSPPCFNAWLNHGLALPVTEKPQVNLPLATGELLPDLVASGFKHCDGPRCGELCLAA